MIRDYQKKHSPTPTHPDHRTSFINFLHSILCVHCVLDSPLWQPLSRSSVVFLLVLDPLLHTPCISSPSHYLLFVGHAHTIEACCAVIPTLCHLYLISLSAPYLEICLSLTPHIHLTILISARWSDTSFSFLTGQISLPCNILLRTQLLYNLRLIIMSLLVSSGSNCLNLF